MFPVYIATLVTTLIMMVESDRAFLLSLTFGVIAYVLLMVWSMIYQVKANAREVQKVLNRTIALHPGLSFKLKKEINPFQTPDSNDPIWIYVIEGLSFH
jgi:regulator of protease activity HflC (stomatin/prohibitin superfamily)